MQSPASDPLWHAAHPMPHWWQMMGEGWQVVVASPILPNGQWKHPLDATQWLRGFWGMLHSKNWLICTTADTSMGGRGKKLLQVTGWGGCNLAVGRGISVHPVPVNCPPRAVLPPQSALPSPSFCKVWKAMGAVTAKNFPRVESWPHLGWQELP